MHKDKLLQTLKENKVIKDFVFVGLPWIIDDPNETVKITLNNGDTLVLDYFGKKLMRSFKNKENKNGFRR